jgi:hypothetical protein
MEMDGYLLAKGTVLANDPIQQAVAQSPSLGRRGVPPMDHRTNGVGG